MSANSATLTEVPSIPRKLRPKEKVPDPKIPEWPKPEWPKELKDLCIEFQDVLVEELESAQQVTCPPMDIELLREQNHSLQEDQGKTHSTGKRK